MNKSIWMFAALLGFAVVGVNAQDKPATEPAKKPAASIFAALDANGDGVIDAQEINNAPAALRKLDKNGDGKLTREEVRPAGGKGDKAPRKAKKQQ
jgi:Ca2+-binding EF-hand superfamily protein